MTDDTSKRDAQQLIERRASIARQMANVIYNVKQTGDWERGKRLLVELQEEFDK